MIDDRTAPLELWTWGRWPDEAPPPAWIRAIPMIRAIGSFEAGEALAAGALERPRDAAGLAAAEAEEYVGRLVDRIEAAASDGEDPRSAVLQLQTYADDPGEGATVPELLTYWTVAGEVIAAGLRAFYGGSRPRGIVIHAEDRSDGQGGRAERAERDRIVEIILASRLARALPGTTIAGYGIQDAPSVVPSITSYGTVLELAAAYGEWSGQIAARGVIPWIPRARFIRHSPVLRTRPIAERIVRPGDVAYYAAAAVQEGARVAVLWGDPLSSTPAAWRETWEGLEVLRPREIPSDG